MFPRDFRRIDHKGAVGNSGGEALASFVASQIDFNLQDKAVAEDQVPVLHPETHWAARRASLGSNS